MREILHSPHASGPLARGPDLCALEERLDEIAGTEAWIK
jgi:hypothetical protein